MGYELLIALAIFFPTAVNVGRVNGTWSLSIVPWWAGYVDRFLEKRDHEILDESAVRQFEANEQHSPF